LYKRLRTELPGKILPPLPHKNKSHSKMPGSFGSYSGNNSETSSISSVSTQLPPNSPPPNGTGHHSDTINRLLSVRGAFHPRPVVEMVVCPSTDSYTLSN